MAAPSSRVSPKLPDPPPTTNLSLQSPDGHLNQPEDVADEGWTAVSCRRNLQRVNVQKHAPQICPEFTVHPSVWINQGGGKVVFPPK